MDHFADRLVASIRAKGNAVCVGLDPRWESLPRAVRDRHADASLDSVARAFEEFCCGVIDVVAPLVPVVKPQSAFFEACGPAGMAALQAVLRHARQRGLLTIWDGKRNDIASTAAAYADAAFGGFRVAEQSHPVWDADAATVNPYLGSDSIEPFIDSARRSGRGIFILVRTSNPGARQFQDLDCSGRPLFMHVADAVGVWSEASRGACGYGAVGAVVGATYPAELAAIRKRLPNVLFLIPGYGAQGGAAADTAPAFREDGLGATVNSSRGILFPFQPDEVDWEGAIERAARATVRDLASATSMGRLSGPALTDR
jgi:orotidine-5'-phosphate decarboxylase